MIMEVFGMKRLACSLSDMGSRSRIMVMTVLMMALMAFPAFAAEGEGSVDIVGMLTTSFQGTATSMLATITATMPVVMSVISAYIIIRFGIKFFMRFAK